MIRSEVSSEAGSVDDSEGLDNGDNGVIREISASILGTEERREDMGDVVCRIGGLSGMEMGDETDIASSLGEAVHVEVTVPEIVSGSCSSSAWGLGNKDSQHIKQNSSSIFFCRSSSNFWSTFVCLASCFATFRATVHLIAAFTKTARARADTRGGLNRLIKAMRRSE